MAADGTVFNRQMSEVNSARMAHFNSADYRLGLAACQRGMSVGFTTAAALVHELMEARDERRLLNLQRHLFPSEPADRRRVRFRPPVPHRRGTPLRGLQPALRAGLHPGHHQPALRRMDRGIWLRTIDWSAAGPAHPPRPHPRDERRQLPPQAQPRERRAPSSRRPGQRITR